MMKTCYADLDIVVDESTGRARMRRQGEAPVKAKKEVKAPDEFDSALEAARARHLQALKDAGEIKRWAYHPFRVKIAKDKWYEIDFIAEYTDGSIWAEEVKGSVLARNARDSITRLHVAATNLPMFRWRLVTRPDGSWEELEV
jgi:hypothetical protein